MKHKLANLALVGALALTASAQEADPAKAQVPLPAADGWNAHLVFDQGEIGIWTVKPLQVFPQYAVPELVGLDDKGTAHVMVSYSGKWTPKDVLADGRWLGGLTQGDLDPTLPGPETYTGGALGHLHQVFGHKEGGLDARRIATFPGRELHTLLAGDLDERTPGDELLVFTRPGGLFRVWFAEGRFHQALVEELAGRVRDVVAIEGTRFFATVARSGELELMRLVAGELERRVVYRDAMGLGRVVLGAKDGERIVLYAAHDDGRVVRVEGALEDEDWQVETVYLGPQGTRGLAVGRFHADPAVESLAVFGYSGRVQLLSRSGAGPWNVETIFTDRDRGHWLAVAELDGRNGTDELVGCGYGGRIFQLSRPPGYGRPGIAVDDLAVDAVRKSALRLAVVGGRDPEEAPSTLSYTGGFVPKTLVFETLVTRGADGHLAPGLATSWEIAPDGLTTWLTLREGARFHDGTLVTPEAVAEHFARWLGQPGHEWLVGHAAIRSVRADGGRLRIDTERRVALLPEMCAINPGGIEASASYDESGRFVAPVGSGPYRWRGPDASGTWLRFEPVAPGLPELALKRCAQGDEVAAVEDVLRGELDGVIDGYLFEVPRRLLAGLRRIEHVEVVEGPGSRLVYLAFHTGSGPLADVERRRAVAAALDRAALIDTVEAGAADVATGWGQTFAGWPQGEPAAPRAGLAWNEPLNIRAEAERWQPLAAALVTQLAAAGIPSRVVSSAAPPEAQVDLWVRATWGLPYDPYLSLVELLASAQENLSEELHAQLLQAATEREREGLYRSIGAHFQDRVPLVPLYVPHRIGVFGAGVQQPVLGRDLYRWDLSSPR